MGTYSRKLRELIEEFDAMEDEDMLELAKEAYKLGCKEGKRKAMEGYGNRMEEDEDDEFEDDESSVRCGSVAATVTVAAVVDHPVAVMAIAVGCRAPDATRDDIVDNHEGGPVSPS